MLAVSDAIRLVYPDAQIQAGIGAADVVRFHFVGGDRYRVNVARAGLLVERQSLSGAFWVSGPPEREIERRLEAACGIEAQA